MALALPTDQEVTAALPQTGKTAVVVSKAATAVQIVNGIDLVAGFFGIVPPGTIPVVVNGIVAIIGGLTHLWANRKAVATALVTSLPSRF